MTSERSGYVHIWLPGRVNPVVCGRLDEQPDGRLDWTIAQSYLAREEAIPIDPVELPLKAGRRRPPRGALHGVVRDASPDAWGRRVQLALRGEGLRELDFLLGTGPDQVGALAVTRGPSVPEPGPTPRLEELLEAARRLEADEPLSEPLATALLRGTSIGGARPKALLEDERGKYVAKFASSTDHYPMVRAEQAAMNLAERCGLRVCVTRRTLSLGKDVLLVERFDRVATPSGESRRLVVSALTLLRLHESEARLASYLDLAGALRRWGADPAAELPELFRRMVFNILVGNTDDHARNHALFWDGSAYRLTPAYDICPDLRAGRTAFQAMAVGRDGRRSTLKNALSEAGQFGLSKAAARAEVERLVDAARAHWRAAADAAGIDARTLALLERETVLGPGCFE